MRQDLNEDARTWLAAGPIKIADPSAVLMTFRAGTAKVVRFVGPHHLLRAAGWDATRGGFASAYGSWWADELELGKIGSKLEKFEGWLPKELLRAAWPAQYRGAAALCEDWNDMREMFRLELPARQEIVGLVGAAAAQPQRSSMARAQASTPFLAGGGEQVYFKRTATLNSVNPLWVFSRSLW